MFFLCLKWHFPSKCIIFKAMTATNLHVFSIHTISFFFILTIYSVFLSCFIFLTPSTHTTWPTTHSSTKQCSPSNCFSSVALPRPAKYFFSYKTIQLCFPGKDFFLSSSQIKFPPTAKVKLPRQFGSEFGYSTVTLLLFNVRRPANGNSKRYLFFFKPAEPFHLKAYETTSFFWPRRSVGSFPVVFNSFVFTSCWIASRIERAEPFLHSFPAL